MTTTDEVHALGLKTTMTLLRFTASSSRRSSSVWADAPRAHKDEAIALKGQQTYSIYLHYLRGCSDLFRDGTSTLVSSQWSSNRLLAVTIHRSRNVKHQPTSYSSNGPPARLERAT